ncbi:MAG: inositol-1-monophosphatase [Arsenophonus endosymbiont of Ceratovacuna japonica]
MHPMLTIAIRAVRKAGDFITKNYEEINFFKKTEKKENNSIIIFNKKTELIMIEIIQKSYPNHIFLTKQNIELLNIKNNIKWIIDPLNGIINFSKKIPHFAVSITVYVNNRAEIVAIYNPMLNELFTAVRGQGAQLNGCRLRVKNDNKLEESIIAINFSFDTKQHFSEYINFTAKLFKIYFYYRCTGSSILDLSYIAANRIDAYFEINSRPWNFIIGGLLIREAGGIITDFNGSYNYLTSGNLLAGNPKIVKKWIQNINLIK